MALLAGFLPPKVPIFKNPASRDSRILFRGAANDGQKSATRDEVLGLAAAGGSLG